MNVNTITVSRRLFSQSCLLHHRYYTDTERNWTLERAKRGMVWSKWFRRGEVDVQKEMEIQKKTTMKKKEKDAASSKKK